MVTRSHSERIAGSLNAPSSKLRGSRGSRKCASATLNGIEYWPIITSLGRGMLLTLAIFSLPAMRIAATSAPAKPCSARRSRIACTEVCAEMWQAKRFIRMVRVDQVSPSPRSSSRVVGVAAEHAQEAVLALDARSPGR